MKKLCNTHISRGSNLINFLYGPLSLRKPFIPSMSLPLPPLWLSVPSAALCPLCSPLSPLRSSVSSSAFFSSKALCHLEETFFLFIGLQNDDVISLCQETRFAGKLVISLNIGTHKLNDASLISWNSKTVSSKNCIKWRSLNCMHWRNPWLKVERLWTPYKQ